MSNLYRFVMQHLISLKKIPTLIWHTYCGRNIMYWQWNSMSDPSQVFMFVNFIIAKFHPFHPKLNSRCNIIAILKIIHWKHSLFVLFSIFWHAFKSNQIFRRHHASLKFLIRSNSFMSTTIQYLLTDFVFNARSYFILTNKDLGILSSIAFNEISYKFMISWELLFLFSIISRISNV